VNDQETEKSALYSKVGASSQMGAKRKKKKKYFYAGLIEKTRREKLFN
jgi:hypothetical protein